MRLLVERVDQSGQEALFAFPGTISSLTAPQPGVEQVPEGVAEHIETENDQRQAQPRPERQPWGTLHVLTSLLAEHSPPARNLGGHSESEKAQ